MTRVEAQVPSGFHVGTMARLAYAFVRGHIDSVVALSRVVRGTKGRSTNIEEEQW